MKLTLAVGYEDESLRDKACVLAAQLNLPLDNNALPRLSVTADKLVMLVQGCLPLWADFNSQTLARRREAGKAQGLVRACRPRKGLRIVDATAGWGRDAAILAGLGADVVMLEREPVMHALLADALVRSQTRGSLLKLSLISIDAITYLHNLDPADYPDVIYIDPMHPARQKSALVKKDMRVLQELIGVDDDARLLLHQAIQKVRQRVVVKWPQRLRELLPYDHSIEGKTVRFDVYVCPKNSTVINDLDLLS